MFDNNALLEKLYQSESLSQPESYSLFNSLMHGELPPAQIASLLTALKVKGESSNEIAGAASAMASNARPFPTPEYAFGDIVGTGGDGHNTINISSAASIVAAACGAPVAKHGSRSVTSLTGSSDLFARFGLDLEMSPETARQCLDETGFCFLFAPNYHPGMRYAAPVRAELKTRTLFNVLGPLANPASPSHGLFGVYSPDLLTPYAETLMLLGYHRALVVHGSGLDELALHGSSQVFDLEHGDIKRYEVTPETFGLKSHPLSAIAGGGPEENQALIEAALAGKGKEAHRLAIAMNCGALLFVSGTVDSYKDGAEMALETMRQGKPLSVIERAAKISQQGAQ